MPISLRQRKLPASRMKDNRVGGIASALIACLVVVGLIGAIGYALFSERGEGISTEDLITQPASRGPFDHIVLEQGEIESSSNIEVTV